MIFDILTIFPEAFESYFKQSILKRAIEKKIIKINIHNLRNYTLDKHRKIDDRPYGGGAGMVFKIEPIFNFLKVLKFVKIKENKIIRSSKAKIILLDPRGKKFDQKMAKNFSNLKRIVLICGHYEGVDERVKKLIDEKISIGNYVLTGGELPAMVITDTVTRLIPNVLGNPDSLKKETFGFSAIGRKKEYSHYTRPSVFQINNQIKWKVPKILFSGNHQKIEEWQRKQAR